VAGMTGGQAIVEALKAQGVDCIFGIPGVHNLAIYDALYDAPELRQVVGRHEQWAGFAADGYARSTGRPGVLVTTTGPGAVNALTAIGEAYSDSSPVLHIASQIDSPYLDADKGFVHETREQTRLFRTLSAWQHSIASVEEIGPTIGEAFERMQAGRPRPVFLEVPQDVLNASGETEIVSAARGSRPEADERTVRRAAEWLARAETPLLYAGGGVIRSGASAELTRLAELLGAPVFTSAPGKGSIPDDHPLAIGNRWIGDPEFERWLAEADAVLAVGTRFTAADTNGWTVELSPGLIQIDVDEAEIGKNYPPEERLVGDARAVLRQLVAEVERLGGGRGGDGNRSEVALARALFDDRARRQWPEPMGLIDTLRSTLERDAILTNDSLIQYWTARHFPIYEPRTYHIPWNFGTLGTALPFAIGSKVAYPDRQVVSIGGDGAFMFAAPEVATAVQEGANVVSIVCNDRGYGAMRRHQRLKFGGRIIASDLVTPDFAALARSCGAEGYRLESPAELGPALREALGCGKPAVIDLPLTLDIPWR
jgi:thiamine pyrophosphate-dependent acetolactate synthase large subunit-like protein